MVVPKELLAVLACPKCKGNIKHDCRADEIVCFSCKLRYPVVDGIPNMVIEDAKLFKS